MLPATVVKGYGAGAKVSEEDQLALAEFQANWIQQGEYELDHRESKRRRQVKTEEKKLVARRPVPEAQKADKRHGAARHEGRCP